MAIKKTLYRRAVGFAFGTIVLFTCTIGLWFKLHTPSNSINDVISEVNAMQKDSERFWQVKNFLKEKIQKLDLYKIENADERRLVFATALYFFPDTLPEHDLEKQVALNNWFQNEKIIEKNPHSKESEVQHEQMVHSIMNFENIDKEKPTLSEMATLAIQVYGRLARR